MEFVDLKKQFTVMVNKKQLNEADGFVKLLVIGVLGVIMGLSEGNWVFAFVAVVFIAFVLRYKDKFSKLGNNTKDKKEQSASVVGDNIKDEWDSEGKRRKWLLIRFLIGMALVTGIYVWLKQSGAWDVLIEIRKEV